MNLEQTRHSKAVKAAPKKKNHDISQTGTDDELPSVFSYRATKVGYRQGAEILKKENTTAEVQAYI